DVVGSICKGETGIETQEDVVGSVCKTDVGTGKGPQGGVVDSCGVEDERTYSHCCIAVSRSVFKRKKSNCGVVASGGIVSEACTSYRSVVASSGVAAERKRP